MRHAAFAALASAGILLAQAPAAPQPGVTFRVEVNFVEIDAVVTDAQGNFVRNLTRDDFELIEEGEPQSIAAFTLVDLPVRKADAPLSRDQPVEPDVRTNLEDFNGRVILLVLDDLQTEFRRSAPVKAAAAQFVRRFVGANDLVAVLHTGSGAKSGQEFTNSHARLLAAIDRFAGQKIPSTAMMAIDDHYAKRGRGRNVRDSADAEREHKARNSLSTLRAAAEFLGGIRGRRKAVVWFGEGIDLDVQDDFAGGFSTTIRDEMRETIGAATRAGVSFYGVDARGVAAGLDEAIHIAALPVEDATAKLGTSAILKEVQRAHDFLQTISTETGGFAVINQNDLNNAFARIIQENSSYYLLGYHPNNDRRDGKFRRVQVRVTRRGLQVRSRPGYRAAKGKPPETGRAVTQADASPEVRDALESPLPAGGLGLRVFAAPFAGSVQQASVAVVVEFDPDGFSFVRGDDAYAEDLEVVVVPVDAAGKAMPGTRDVASMQLLQRAYDAVRANGFRMTRRFDLAPGRYQLHVAARAANSRRVGSLTYDLDVPDFTKPAIAMSGLVLASANTAHVPTPPPDKAFLDLVPEVPTATREFSSDDTLSLRADIYDNRLSTAHRVAIDTTVIAGDGRVAFKSNDERPSEEIVGKSGGFTHTMHIPLAAFAPGRYVLRVEARMMLSHDAVALREVAFSVRSQE